MASSENINISVISTCKFIWCSTISLFAHGEFKVLLLLWVIIPGNTSAIFLMYDKLVVCSWQSLKGATFIISDLETLLEFCYSNQRAVTDLGCYHTTKDQRRLNNLIISWYSKNRQFSILSTVKLSVFGNLHLKPVFNFHGTTQPLLIYSFPELIWLLEAPFTCGTNCYRQCSHSKRHCLKIVWGH